MPRFRFLLRIAIGFAAISCVRGEPEMLVEGLDGPVTAKEIAAFKAYMQAQPLPTDNNHNAMVYGTAGAAVEALGTMFNVTHDRAILDRMIEYTDAMLAARNDPDKGRVIWTGQRELVWPNKALTDGDARYSGTENGDVMAHIAYAAKLMLRELELTDAKVASGDRYGFGATYGKRARRYVSELDRTADTFLLKWFVEPKTLAYRWPTSDRYGTLGPRYDKSRGKGIPWNQQMMMNGAFQRLAECHELLQDDTARVLNYDAIVKASCSAFLANVKRYQVNGADCYKWSYASDDPALEYIEDTAHAGYDILICRAYLSGRYGLAPDAMRPFASTLRYVIARGPHQFAERVDGSGDARSELGSTWLYLSLFDPKVFGLVAAADLERAKTKPDIVARILWWKNRRDSAAGGQDQPPESGAALP